MFLRVRSGCGKKDGGAGNSEEKGEEWKSVERRGGVMMIKLIRGTITDKTVKKAII